ncbi:12955_t:CDS:1, partial [Gigaspora rosea]
LLVVKNIGENEKRYTTYMAEFDTQAWIKVKHQKENITRIVIHEINAPLLLSDIYNSKDDEINRKRRTNSTPTVKVFGVLAIKATIIMSS